MRLQLLGILIYQREGDGLFIRNVVVERSDRRPPSLRGRCHSRCNYFPDKQSIAFTLVNQYSQELEAHWKPLMEQAEILTHAEFADRFIERITQFVQKRPAYLSLLAAPIRFRRDPAARKASRIAIANAFQAKNPSLSNEQSLLAANLSLQIVRGMMTLYAEADSKGKALVVAEFKKLLTLYLRGVLSEDEASAK